MADRVTYVVTVRLARGGTRLAKIVDVREDDGQRVYTVRLRSGSKWSKREIEVTGDEIVGDEPVV